MLAFSLLSFSFLFNSSIWSGSCFAWCASVAHICVFFVQAARLSGSIGTSIPHGIFRVSIAIVAVASL